MHPNATSVGSIALFAALIGQPACLDDTVQGNAVTVDHTNQALSSEALASANGTYGGGCIRRSGSWSVEIASGATLDNAPLSVILNNTACVLTLTSLRAGAGALTATPAIPLGTSYAGSASSFGGTIQFYANAKLSSTSFAADFLITIPFSDDASLADGDNTAGFDVVEATATGQSVPAPNYVLDASGLALLTDVNDVVSSATGTAALTTGSVAGQTYVVVDDSGLDTYAELDTAYLAGSSAAIASTIPAAAFALVGDDLTTAQVRTLIIANTSNGVRSYQAFAITFHAAP